MPEGIATGRDATAPFLVPPRNCWCPERATRLSFLIDGDAYYRALRDAFARAKHSIFIVAWDCDRAPLRVVATHLGPHPGERREQVRRLLAAIDATAGDAPTVLAGDVNEWFLWGRPLRWLHDHFSATPGPRTFPAGRPVFALDRVWVRP